MPNLSSDARFDLVYPERYRAWSRLHWTPVRVARRAAALLEAESVLDVGAGAGKFCVIGALTTPARYLGVERRYELVRLARAAARELGVAGRARFELGSAFDYDWKRFDGFYLFNPYFDVTPEDVKVLEARYRKSIAETVKRLSRAHPGTRVATYFGFGGKLPAGFKKIARQKAGRDWLEVWEKTR